jgi:tRNA threonylcarbamoyl adenosine modification protein YjeE
VSADPSPILLSSLDDTRALAIRLAGSLRPGDVIALDGPMGAGKTTFTRFLVEALGGDPSAVASPSYTLLHQYPARIPVVHVDAWRLGGAGDLDGLGFAEAAAEAVAIVEWAERVGDALHDARRWHIALAHAGEGRTATITAPADAAWEPPQSQATDGAQLRTMPMPAEAQVATPPPAVASGAPATPAGGAVVKIPVVDGGDPLVRDYLAAHRPTTAWTTFSWLWLAIGAVAALVGAIIGSHLYGTPPALASGHDWMVDLLNAHLGNWEGVLLGAAGGAAIASLAGGFLMRRSAPAAQEPWYAALLLTMPYFYYYDRLVFVGLVAGAVCAVYAISILFRLLAVAVGHGGGMRRQDLPEPPGGWPVYTVLVPLYRERNVARNILRSLNALDYPRERLDVKFLLEADDPETLAALTAAGIPSFAEVVVVPQGQPKTKPRACNHGLARAKGEFLVIFDAEDRPDIDQLKQAVWAFRDLDAAGKSRVVCLQAQLAYHNHDQNLLTRWFAIEYNVWFRRYLGGLVRLRVPIPLGGTSNHFRTAPLAALGGWDPFNVTEDCDLGVRLHIAGYRTVTLDSVTWEEANSRVGNWIRQRSRWLKGYAITHLVWSRRPLWLLWKLGPWSAAGFAMSVFCVSILAALNLIFWIFTAVFLVNIGTDLAHGVPLAKILAVTGDLDRLAIGQHATTPLVYLGPDEHPQWSLWSIVVASASGLLFLGNLAFIGIAVVFGRRPGQRGLLLAALLSPLYWVLIAIASWKGLWQLIVKPHYWEKTVHGLDQGH